MRRHGAVGTARGFGLFPHLAWTYRDRSQFVARAAEYVTDALDRDQRVEYVGDSDRVTLRAELASMPGVDDRLTAGQVLVTPVRDFYPFRAGTDVVNAEAAAATYAAATQRAIEDGYTGYRSVVDATAVARTPEQRAAFARCEYLVDQQMAVLPCSALCGYDASLLGTAAAELICLHPLVQRGTVPFRLYAETNASFALAGEIDASTSELFTTTLERVWPLSTGDEVVINAAGLEFIGPAQLLMVDQYARTHARHIVLQTSQPIPVRLAGLLDLTNVRVEDPGQSPGRPPSPGPVN